MCPFESMYCVLGPGASWAGGWGDRTGGGDGWAEGDDGGFPWKPQKAPDSSIIVREAREAGLTRPPSCRAASPGLQQKIEKP
eukprot:scaffold128112_cov48-Phaeocystis_antarctica.AAC.2